MEPITGSASARFVTLPSLPDALTKIGIERHLLKNERISQSSGTWSGCYYVKEGLVGAYGLDSSGGKTLTFLLEESALFLEANMIDDAVFAESETISIFKAEKDTTLLFFPKAEFQYAMKHDVETANFVAVSCAQKMLAFRFLLNTARTHSVLWRVADLLQSFAESHGVVCGNCIKIDYPLSQQLIAEMLHTNRITVTKAMKQLREMEFIEKRDELYFIIDQPAFNNFIKHAH